MLLTLLIGAPTQSPVARSYIASSGSIVEIFAGSDPTLGPVVPAYITNVAANPQFTLNGAPVSVQGPFWHSAAKNAPMVAYQLPNPVGAADVVTWSAPAGWLTTNLGTCGPGNAVQCENYAGASEPGTFGYLPFSIPAAQQTLKVGFNGQAGEAGEASLLKNIIHRLPPMTGATWRADFFPLTVTAANGMAFQTLWSAGDGNGINLASFPAPAGQWTMIADEANPAAPMVVNLVSRSVTVSAPTITGTGIAKRWDWQVSTPISAATWNPALQLQLVTTAGSPNTLSNFRMFEPGNAPCLNPGVDGHRQLRFASSTRFQSRAPARPLVRFMEALGGSDGASRSITRRPTGGRPQTFRTTPRRPLFPYSRASRRPRQRPTRRSRARVRFLSGQGAHTTTQVSPYVYTSQQYKRTAPSQGYSNYQWSPAAFGLDYSWAATPAASYPTVVIEFVCGDKSGNPINHNLQSGQLLGFGAMTVPVTNAKGTGLAQVSGGSWAVWVTGPSTFISVFRCQYPARGAKPLAWASGTVSSERRAATIFVPNGQ